MQHVRMVWRGGRRLAVWLVVLALLAGTLTVRGQAWAARAVGWPVGNERLWAAVAMQDVRQLRRAFAEGADAEAGIATTGLTPLLLAATDDRPELVRELLAHGAKPDTAAPDGSTPLHNAAYNGRTQNVRILLESQADPNRMTARQTTPLICAIHHGCEPAVSLLLEHGARLDVGDRRVLVEAAESELAGPELVERLIAAGVDVNEADGRGVTPYQAARQAGRKDLVAVLLRHGARPEAQAARPIRVGAWGEGVQ